MATRKQSVLPLLDIESPAFAQHYEYGVWWSMYGDEQGQGPLSIYYLKTNLERYSQQSYFEQQDLYWRHHIGFYLGMYHGGVLSPQTGQLRPGVTALILFDHPQARRSYSIGREAFFHEPGPEYRYTESTLIDHVQKTVMDAPYWKEPEGTWNYVLGCLLGELSGVLFPETPQEYRQWESEHVQVSKVVERRVLLQEA